MRACALQLSKEVRALRTYEASLLDSYHTYLKGLLRVSDTAVRALAMRVATCVLCGTHLFHSAVTQAYKTSNSGQAPLQQGRIAVKCMAGLLEAAPHFNYRSGGQGAKGLALLALNELAMFILSFLLAVTAQTCCKPLWPACHTGTSRCGRWCGASCRFHCCQRYGVATSQLALTARC